MLEFFKVLDNNFNIYVYIYKKIGVVTALHMQRPTQNSFSNVY